MQRWIAILSMLMLALAGCTDDTEGSGADGPDGADGSDGSGGSDGAGGSGGASNNTAPTASLVTKSANVTVPGNVTLTINGTDVDGDDLSWTLTMDGDKIAEGDTLPSEFVQTLESEGNYTFMLVVSDGEASAEASVEIQGIAAPDLGPDPVTIPLDISMSCFQCYISNVGPAPDNCLGLQQGENNEDCAWTEIDETWRGRAFSTDGPFDVDVAWYTSCEAGQEIDTIGAEGHDTGVIHDSAGCMVLWDWDANPEAGVITIQIA